MEEEQKKIEEEYYSNLKSDYLFKYVMVDKTDDYAILREVIEAFTGLKVKIEKIENPEIKIGMMGEKGMILDILVKDSSGKLINIEMQNSKLTENELLRFQNYNCKLVFQQPKKGEVYKGIVKEVYQILIVDDKIDDDLVSHYKMRKEDGSKLPYALQNIIIVSLKNVRQITKRKESMNKAELFSYVFENGIDDDILKLNGGIKLMKDRINLFNEDFDLKFAAMNAEQREFSRQLLIEEELKEAKQKAKEEGKLETNIQVCKELMKSLDKSLEEVMDLMHLEESVKQKVREAIK